MNKENKLQCQTKQTIYDSSNCQPKIAEMQFWSEYDEMKEKDAKHESIFHFQQPNLVKLIN